MLENLLTTGAAIAPFFVYLMMGMFLRRVDILDEELTAGLNSLIFWVLMPVNFFKSMYRADIKGMFGAAAVPYAMVSTLVIMFLWMRLAKRMSPDPARQGALAHAGYQGNLMMFSLPLAQSIAGDAPQVLMILTAMVVVLNFTSIPLMEHYRGLVRISRGQVSGEEKTGAAQLFIRLLKVPLVDAVLLGLVWSLLALPMPPIGVTVVNGLAGCVIPLAFIVMGSRLDFARIKANSGVSLRHVFLKLIAIPAVFMILPLALCWDSASIATLIAGFGAPSAVVSVSTSESYECDGNLAGEIVTISSFLALFTMFVWIFCLKQLGFIG
ncbi:MAG: AEC family transporter [Firmicutes bacterium]|nr:AEC family transporter [Bacillota bacterium]